jgi:hypothetical protein
VERWKTQTTIAPHYWQADRSTATGKCEPRKWYPHVSVTLFALCIQSNRVPSHDSLFVSPSRQTYSTAQSQPFIPSKHISLTHSHCYRPELCWLPRSICACSWDESAGEMCAGKTETSTGHAIFALSACMWWERKMKVSHGRRVNSFHLGSFSSRGRFERNLCVDECGVCGMGMKWIIVCQTGVMKMELMATHWYAISCALNWSTIHSYGTKLKLIE